MMSKKLNITLWVIQIILGLAFLMAGISKTFSPIPDLAAQLGWPGVVPVALVRFIGVSELLGALGLLLPALFRWNMKWTVWAAAGLTFAMLSALIFHIARGEFFAIPINLTLGGLAFFIAWGRNKSRNKN